MAPNPYAPALTPQQLFIEKAWLQGALLGSVAYGCVAVLAFMCLYLLLQRKDNASSRNTRIALIAYVSIIFVFSTIFQACNVEFTQLAFVENREYPGGPAAYENDFWNIPVDAVGNVLFVLTNWMTDSILLWRFMVIYRQCRFPIWTIMTFPCTMFLGSMAMGSLFLHQLFIKNPFQAANGINWTLPYLALSLSLNIILTISIVGRLTVWRIRIRRVMGSDHGSQYTGIASMIVESAALHAVLSLLFLIPDGIGHPLSIIFLQTLMPDQVLASLLIIFRVARGKAWSSETSGKVMSSFAPRPIPLSSIQFAGGVTQSETETARMTSNSGSRRDMSNKADTIVDIGKIAETI
ncbi:hypothetical protein B0H15DRAFT_902416 [Mycena belliarum]|uniref:Uncharacterized protein n=1 Tax=Mycena belliarum TaxID=1033014 RepID=A0AAD6UCA2_9AGAR|nr:hypothetical protein B0H15DRAFT_902416 [Mycena belliae]